LVHPDKFPSGPQKQRAEALSSRINEAYRTLADPLSRAQYLLAYLHNVDVNAEDGAQTHPQDKETLMQVLEVQEAIEEAEDETLVAELRTENEQRIDECVDTLGKALEREDVETARAACVNLRFWYNIRDCLREWEPRKEVRVIH
jgi:molecular chaperone HscB